MTSSKRWNLFFLFLGFVAVLLIWSATLLLVPFLANLLVDAHDESARLGLLTSYGAFGSMFGAINALFSGLALGAIALTLWVESRSRREARKPLVIGGVESGDVLIHRPVAQGSDVLVRIKVPVSLSNQTSEAALNVSVRVELKSEVGGSETLTIDGPLLKDADQKVELSMTLPATNWRVLLDKLTAEECVEVELTTLYRSLESIDWKTIVVYEFSVHADEQHYNLLNTVRNGRWNLEGEWDPEALVAVSTRIKPGSWSHMMA